MAFRTGPRQLRPEQVVGAPSWVAASQFDIIATRTAANSDEEVTSNLPAFLRSLLEQRFGLRAHMDKRPLPVYALTVARADGQLGAQLRFVSPGECAEGNNTPTDDRPSCATHGDGRGKIGSQMSMRRLADFLTDTAGLDRSVVDQTGLAGIFDISLQWSPEPLRATPDSGRGGADATALPEGPSLFTAVQSQLGLKLEPRDALTDVVVIDHIEPPSPN